MSASTSIPTTRKDSIFTEIKQKRNLEWVEKHRQAVKVTKNSLEGQPVTPKEIEQYLGAPMKTWFWDGLMLDPVFDAHREHPAMKALAARHSRPDAVRGAAP